MLSLTRTFERHYSLISAPPDDLCQPRRPRVWSSGGLVAASLAALVTKVAGLDTLAASAALAALLAAPAALVTS